MKSSRSFPTVVAVLAAAVVFVFQPSAAAGDDDEAAVRTAAAEFYAALNAMFKGDLEPMKAVWSHASDVTYMGPGGGMQVGWKDVHAAWKEQAAQKLGGSVEPKDMHIIVEDDLAVVQNFEVGENTTPDGKVWKVSIRATNVFREEDDEWKMIGHHTDLLPFVAE